MPLNVSASAPARPRTRHTSPSARSSRSARAALSARRVEALLEANTALTDLDRLVQAGCDRATILGHLELIRDAVVFDDLAYWTGRNRHGVHAAQRQLGACATLVDSLLSHPIKVALVAALTGRSSLDAISASRGLRQLNAALHALLMKLSGRNHLHDHLQRALLVRYVLQQTGKAHDPEVSALIAAVLCRERYSPQAHQQWRLTTYPPLAGLLHAADAAFTAPAFCSESCPPPRPPLRSPITAGSRPPIGAASRQRILVHRPDTFGPYPYAGSTS